MALPDVVLKKLRNPHLQLSLDDSMECILACIDRGFDEAAAATGKNLVVIIGNTGAGKSTFVNYLNGCTMEAIARKDAGLEGRGLVVRVKPDSATPELMPIGHTKQSMTFVPQVGGGDDATFTFCDCPGFLDNRGAEINIANAVNIKQTVHAASRVVVTVLINYHSLKADRGRGIGEMLKILADLFGSTEQLHENLASVIVGISQAPFSENGINPVSARGMPIVVIVPIKICMKNRAHNSTYASGALSVVL